MLEYAVLTTLYWSAFYGLYALALRRHTFFRLNRGYLIAALAAGLALPMLDGIYGQQPETAEAPVFYVAPVVAGFDALNTWEAVITAAPVEEAFPWKTVLLIIYLVGAAFGLVRLSIGLSKLWKLWQSGERTRIGGRRVVLTRSPHLPFSFANTIFLWRNDQWTPEEEADILRHEQAHISDGHTADVLLLELLRIVFWFSPPLYLYRNALRLVHEYIADAEVLRTRNRSEYGRLLLRQAVPGLQISIAHSFHSSLKQRISMMTKTKSKAAARWQYLVALPLTLGLMLLFSQRSAIAAALPELPAITMEIGDTTDVYKMVEEMPRFSGCEEEATVEARKACADKKMLEFIYKNLHYPAPAREKKIEGIVVVSFIIEKDGSVSNAEIKREIGGGCGEETLRVIGLMPQWIPGKQKGEVVRVQMNLPVRYKLDTATDQKEVIADHSIIIDSDKKELKTSVDGVPMVIGMKDEKSENKPLFYVNGERLSNEDGDLSHINPDNIKEISVLKGESAIAFAGQEGKNGVILITLYKPGEKPVKVPVTEGDKRLGTLSPLSAQNIGDAELFKVVEEMPRFPGCEDNNKNCADKKMLEFIYQNLRYPALARENEVEGTVVVSFIVERNGKITEPKIVREIGGGCGDEVMRVVNLMPTWIPGKQKGEAVRVQFNLPVRFQLENKEKPDNAPNATSKALPVEDFKIFPNPSKGRFTVSFSAPQKNTEIQVLNAEGSAVFSRVLNQFPGTFRDEIDLGKAPKGNYVLVVRQGELVHTANIVKQ